MMMLSKRDDRIGFLPQFLDRSALSLLFLFVVAICPSFAQQPGSLTVMPTSITQGQCYTMTVANGQNMTLDVWYTVNYAVGGTGGETIIGWPTLNGAGTAEVCTDSSTIPGLYKFIGIRNTLEPLSDFTASNAFVTVTGTPDFSISINPSSRNIGWGQSATYTVAISVENGFNSAISLSATDLPPGALASFNPPTIFPGQSSSLTITSSQSTVGAYGIYDLTVTGSGAGVSHAAGATLTINPPPQPSFFAVNPSQVHAGNDPYTVSIGNASNMLVDVQYNFVDNQGNFIESNTGAITMNSVGQWTNTLDHYHRPGSFIYTAIKNHWRVDWVPLNSITLAALPPKPTSLAINPSTVSSGQDSYTATALHGAAMYVDVKYRLTVQGQTGPELRADQWAYLEPVSSGSPNGRTIVPVQNCTPPGTYEITWIKNSINSDSTGATVSAPITVNSGPAVTSSSPTNASTGFNGSVVINGRNLCGVTLSSAWPGLTITNVSSYGASATATFNVAPNAQIGNATINLAAAFGTISFLFPITNSGAPVVTAVTPSSGSQNATVAVVLTGANLAGATLSTTWNGLTFSNVNASAATSLNATFLIASTALVGTPTIRVSNSVGFSDTQLFSISQAASASKEYIYLGNRIIAVDVGEGIPHQPDLTAPTNPSNLTATAFNSSQINLTWTASTDNVGVAGYRIERCLGSACSLFAQISTPSAASYNDIGLSGGTTYRYRVRSVDAAGNLSGYSNVTTASTPATPDTQPPTAPSTLTATALNSTQMNLVWIAAVDNIGVSGYRLERCQGIGCSSFAQIASPVGTSYNDTGLTAGSIYSYRVRAIDSAGNLSAYSNVASANTPATPDTQPPTAPSSLTAIAAGSSQVNLTWIASADNTLVAGYRLERCQGISCNNFLQVATPAGTSHTDTGLSANMSYSYRLRATDSAGNVSLYSNTVTVATPASTGPDFQHHRQITINPGQVPTPQSNFPVLISGVYPYLATIANGGQVQSPIGIDIKFTSDAEGNNLLPYEQEKYVAATGQIAYWVKLPFVADGASFHVFYGNSGAVDQSNKAGVWDVNFKGVWHLGEVYSISSGNYKDSTTNPAHGTLTDANASSSSQAGAIGNGVNLSGDADSIDIGNPSKLQITGSMTISAWIRLQDYSAGANRIVSKSGLGGNLGWEFSLDDWIGPNWNNLTLFTPATGSTFAAAYQSSSIPTSQWIFAVAAYDATTQTVRLYRNGAVTVVTTEGIIPASLNNAPYSVKIGARAANSGAPFHGNIDEVRISSMVRSADWIRTEYNNQISPASFYSVGSQSASDVIPPMPPSNLIAVAVSSNQINLNWTAATDNTGVTTYRLERCQGSACSNFVQIATPPGTSYSDTTANSSSSYSYRVLATDSAGNLSGYSNIASAVTPAMPDSQPPSAPGNLTALAFGTNQINLDWIASSDNVNVTEYRIDRCQGAGCTNFTALATVGAVTNYIDSAVTPGTPYSYRLRASDAAGNVGPYSNTASAITPNSSGYQYRRQITINAGQAPSAQTNFPVLISGTYPYLATVANGGKVQSSNGIDIKFTSDAAGINILPYEQEKYVAATGQIAYWVKLPMVTTGTTFYVFYGNVSAVDQSDKVSVWDSSFKGVWHLSETYSTASGNFKDSTVSPAHGTLSDVNGTSSSQSGVIGNALSFSGDADSIDVGNPSKLQITGSMTISAWVRLQDYSSPANRIVSKSGINGNIGWEFSLDDWVGPNWNNLTLFTPPTGSTFAGAYEASPFPAGQWIYAAVAYDADAQMVRLYRNGSPVAIAIDGTIPASLNNTAYSVKIGARAGNNGAPFHGNIDEVRISSAVRSADWIRTEYNNHVSPASFYAIGPEQ